MTKLKAHIEGDKIVLDEPLPQPIKPDIQVEVVLYDPEDHPLSKIARRARDLGVGDLSRRHDDYAWGSA